jgi:beta-lactamase regulating signal transducer with metallopeptidase domain
MSLLAIRLPEMIGLTILHSLWQITLLWIVLIAVLKLWPKASSSVRYMLAISTLIVCVLTTAATTVYEWQSYATSKEVSALSNDTSQPLQAVYINVKQPVVSRIMDVLNTSVPLLAWFWCVGLVVMGARFGGSLFYLRTLRAQENIIAIPDVWEQELKRLSIALGLRCDVAIAISARISSPLSLGSISPIILLPAGLLSGLSTAQIEAILVHELYHIKRRDYIINICQALVEVLLFYHPAIWHINNIIREERENCCDDQTVAFCGDAIAYARALTQIQEINSSSKPSLAMSATGPNANNFTNRIKRLFNIYPNPTQARTKGIFAIGFLIVYLGIVLAGANVSAARSIASGKNLIKKSVNDRNTRTKLLSDSIIVGKHPDAVEEREITPKRVVIEEIRLVRTQRADTIVSEQSLDKCLQKVRLLLKMASISGRPGESFRFSKFSAQDSLQIALKLQPVRFSGTVNSLRIIKLDLVAGTDNETGKDIVLEKSRRAVVDSITNYNSQQAINNGGDGVIDEKLKPQSSIEEFTNAVAVRVFPNSTNGQLNISFTPARGNSRVKLVLIDSDGNVVKEITDSTYDNVLEELQVDVSSYKKGIYILQINIDGVRSHQRVVVE